jgi:uncharacterized protein (DUF433 family)
MREQTAELAAEPRGAEESETPPRVSPFPHIHIDRQGVAWITGANTKVVEVVLDKWSHGWSAEEIHFQHPHLSLAQIYAALSYYYDHQESLDEEIAQRLRTVEACARAAGDSPVRARLRKVAVQI